MNKEPELLPCPFCTSTDLRIVKLPKISSDLTRFEMIPNAVNCLGCGCDGPAFWFVKDVVQAWNDRK